MESRSRLVLKAFRGRNRNYCFSVLSKFSRDCFSFWKAFHLQFYYLQTSFYFIFLFNILSVFVLQSIVLQRFLGNHKKKKSLVFKLTITLNWQEKRYLLKAVIRNGLLQFFFIYFTFRWNLFNSYNSHACKFAFLNFTLCYLFSLFLFTFVFTCIFNIPTLFFIKL